MLRVRPSSMPRYADCPSSALPAVAPVNVATEESDLGQAAHEALAQHVLGVAPDLGVIARAHGVELGDLEPLYRYGTQAWRELAKHFPRPQVELQLLETDITTGGRTDLLSVSLEAMAVGDWKSGRLRRNQRHQMGSYAYGVREQFGMPSSGVIITAVVWLRFGEVEVLEWTSDALDAWAAEVRSLEQYVGSRFAPGEHCGFCPRQLECEARAAWLRSVGSALVAGDGSLAVATPEQLAALYPKAQAFEALLKSYRAALRLAIEENGGKPIPMGDGRAIGLIDQPRDTIDARLAWPVLEAHGLTEEDLAACTTIGKGALEDVVGAKAPRGQKGKAKAALIDELRQVGAITTTTHQRLDVAKQEV